MNLNFNIDEPVINYHDDQISEMLVRLSDYFDFDDDLSYYYINVPLDIIREFKIKNVNIRFLDELELIISDMMLKLNRNPFDEITCGLEIDLESRAVELTGINFELIPSAYEGAVVTSLYYAYQRYLRIEDHVFDKNRRTCSFLIDATPR